MAASSKFNFASGSPDQQLYASGQRGSYASASLDRSGSFRENMQNPILSALPSMSRSSSVVAQADVISFMQCLRFDPKALAVDHKLNRQGDFNRLASVALGAPDDSPPGSLKGRLSSSSPEELKRLRVGLRESASKARDRVKIFSESLSVINKCFPNIPSRKRSRSDAISGDRSNPLLGDRSVLGGGVGKIGGQNHGIASVFDFEQQKIEERAKNAIPNKRTRTAKMDQRVDGRPNTPARSAGNVDREKEMLRPPNSNAVQSEDRALSVAVDGWEKAKMKKKRSGIKADVVPSPSLSPVNEGYREPKQGMLPRHLSDARSRLNDGFRQGAVNGVGVGKTDGTSQQTALGMRSSIPRLEQDNVSLPHDKRERTSGSDKEKTNLRAVNKVNAREELRSSSPTSSGKLQTAARAPRSGSGVAPKLSPVIQRASAANDWELSPCTSKNPVNVGSTNRRSKPPNRSSSPPVTQWADRRPQKMPRTARRTNLVPISSIDETPPSDTTSDVAGSENGSSFTRRMSGSSPQQIQLRDDHLPSATLSESEESGATEIKSRDKGKRTDEVDVKVGQNIQKLSTLVLPPRKNKLVNGEDLVDGIRRQGRTGRGFASSRSSPMTVEKLGNVGAAKQLRSAKLGIEKNESKPGRPPTRKLSDRKAYTRQKLTTINPAADFLDDGHAELLAAANAVINPGRALSSSFWRQMEPFFCFLSDLDMSFLKQQGSVTPTVTPKSVALDVDRSDAVPKGFRLIKSGSDATGARGVECGPEQSAPVTTSSVEVPICQRLLAALITEEENEEPSCSGYDDHNFYDYGSRFNLDADLEYGSFSHLALQSFDIGGEVAFDSYGITSAGRSCNELEQSLPDNIIMSMTDTGLTSSCDHSQNGLLLDRAMLPVACSEYLYGSMSLHEKLLLEIQSIGLYPEPVPDLAQTGEYDIYGDICRLEDSYREQVSRKKILIDRLLKSACEAREIDEKDFEQHSLDKLVGMAYQKYMSCWGPNAPGGKNASGKMAKQAALAFVQRTLERCQEFEVTGKSCFAEPPFREMFLSGSLHQNAAQPGDTIGNGDSGRLYGVSADVRVSGSQLSPSLNNNDIYSDALLSANHSFEQFNRKDDAWSNRVKKRELLLDDVAAGTASISSGSPLGIGATLLSNAKGKRSDREGKGNSREVLSRNGTTKVGRPASANVKGERKTKTKPKQKTTQLSVSVNGILGKMSEQPKTTVSSVAKSSEMRTSSSGKEKGEYGLDILGNSEAVDFSNLHLPEMDVLGVGDDLGEQEDIGSWLNIDDDGLQDDDFMGLEIPMDDLSDLNMMV